MRISDWSSDVCSSDLGPDQTFIERKGKLEIAQIQFRDEEHLFQIAQRICNSVGRRVDQTTPLADARLTDGSRVNVIVPPLSLRGPAISIRKFSAKPIRSEERRVGTEGVSTLRSRWSTYHQKKKIIYQN